MLSVAARSMVMPLAMGVRIATLMPVVMAVRAARKLEIKDNKDKKVPNKFRKPQQAAAITIMAKAMGIMAMDTSSR